MLVKIHVKSLYVEIQDIRDETVMGMKNHVQLPMDEAVNIVKIANSSMSQDHFVAMVSKTDQKNVMGQQIVRMIVHYHHHQHVVMEI